MPTIIDGATGVNKVAPGTVNDTSLAGAFEDTLVRTTDYPGYNYVINGNFDIWQRGTSQTTNPLYGSDDRWINYYLGSSRTHSRQSFAVGESFPDGVRCPTYYSRTVVTSVVGVANNVVKSHRIESVYSLAGNKATLSFYAKADTPKNIAVDMSQGFGTGGSPSAYVTGICVNKLTLTTSWVKYTLVVDVPSISGKVIGSDDNDLLQLNFWFDAGTSFNARTATLGQQSGTFDIAAVSLVEGDKDIKPIPRSVGEELALCQRYYETGYATAIYNGTTTNITFGSSVKYNVIKRTVPIVTCSGSPVIEEKTIDRFTFYKILNSSTWYKLEIYTADAEL